MNDEPNGSRIGRLIRLLWRTDLKSFSFIGVGLLLGGWVFIFLTGRLGLLDKDSANAIQAIASVILNPVLNRKFTWKERKTTKWKVFRRYTLAKVVTVGINLFVFAQIPDYTVGYAFSNVLIMALNYPIMRVFVYGEGGFWHDLLALFETLLSWGVVAIHFLLRAVRSTYDPNPPSED